MRLTLIARESERDPRAPANEDLAGWTDTSVWLLDGATGLAETRCLPGPSDAKWLVERMDEAFRRFDPDPCLTLPGLLREAVQQVREEFARDALRIPLQRFEEPSASMIFLRCRRGQLEYAVLGDCRALFERGGEIGEIHGFGRIEALDRQAIVQMQRLRASAAHLDYLAVRAAILPLLREHRMHLNTPGGYWALGLEPEAVDHMATGILEPPPSGEVLLLTDGFYRLVDTFAALSPQGLLARVRDDGATTLVKLLRQLEELDPECLQHPRLKAFDDASAVLVGFEGASAGLSASGQLASTLSTQHE